MNESVIPALASSCKALIEAVFDATYTCTENVTADSEENTHTHAHTGSSPVLFPALVVTVPDYRGRSTRGLENISRHFRGPLPRSQRLFFCRAAAVVVWEERSVCCDAATHSA